MAKCRNKFKLGDNWREYLCLVDEKRIREAENSLVRMLGPNSLEGQTFFDVGSGSGLFSLAARRLGAQVHSFDADEQSVECTGELKRMYFPDDKVWVIEKGSVCDEEYVRKVGKHQIVYSWGVLHHTGNMWAAIDRVTDTVKPGGTLYISIYNDQGIRSRYWKWVKVAYSRNRFQKYLLTAFHLPIPLARMIRRWCTGRELSERGMSLWYDYVDWIGGYPFEVARPEEVVEYFARKGFVLVRLKTCGGRCGCNEYVFRNVGLCAGGVNI